MAAAATTTTNSRRKTKKKATRKTSRSKKQFTQADLDSALAKERQALADERERMEEELREKYERERLASEFADEEPSFADDEEGEGLNGLFEGQREEILEDDDIFTRIDRDYANKPVFYQVKRNGEFVGQFWHPDCSWQSLKEQYGGGQYVVQAKDGENKRIITQQVQRITSVAKPSSPEREEREPIYNPPPQNHETAFNPNTLIEFFQRVQEMNRTDQRRDEREEKRYHADSISSFNTLMMNQQKASQDMFLQMQKQTADMIKEINSNTTKMIEKQDDKFSRLIEKIQDSSKNKDEFGPMQLISMLQDAESKGWSKMKEVMELAEARAEERREEDLANREENSGGTMKSLISSIVPLITQTSKQLQMNPALMQPPGYAAPMPPRVPPARHPMAQPIAVRPPMAPPGRAAVPQQAIGRPGVQARPAPQQRRPVSQPRPATPSATKPPESPQAAANPQKKQTIDASGQPSGKSGQKNTLGLPTMSDKTVKVAAQVVEPKKTLQQLFDEATDVQRFIASAAVPKIAEYIDDPKLTARDAATLTLAELEQVNPNLKPNVVWQHFTFDFMLQIARQFGLGDEKRPWFEEFYAHIEDSARMDDVEGEPALG